MFWLIVFVALLSLLAIGISWLYRKSSMTEAQEREQSRQLNIKAAKNLDVALSDWLTTLKLPQLEEQTKRLEVARQLRIGLIEKLLLSQNPDYSQTEP